MTDDQRTALQRLQREWDRFERWQRINEADFMGMNVEACRALLLEIMWPECPEGEPLNLEVNSGVN